MKAKVERVWCGSYLAPMEDATRMKPPPPIWRSMVRYRKAHAFGIALKLSVSRVGFAAQPNVKSICAFGKVAAKLIMAELCLNRS